MRYCRFIPLHLPIGTVLGLNLMGVPTAHAEFLADSKGTLEARNFYFNRDFRQEGARDKAEEWAQGFLLRIESGYTAGTLGFGLDALGMAGFKLDSGGGTAGTNLLPADSSGGSQDRYGELGLSAKVRLSNSTLKLGTLQIKDPVVNSNDTRLLPGTFKGGQVNVQEIDRLKLTGGQLTRINFVDSTDYQDLTANRIGGTSDRFQFAGADYQFLPNLTAQYRYGKLEDIYRQNYLGFVHTLDLGGRPGAQERRALFAQHRRRQFPRPRQPGIRGAVHLQPRCACAGPGLPAHER